MNTSLIIACGLTVLVTLSWMVARNEGLVIEKDKLFYIIKTVEKIIILYYNYIDIVNKIFGALFIDSALSIKEKVL